jgi:membrane protein YqaA with SNARE-associated domain
VTESPAPEKKPHLLRRLYLWSLSWADHPQAVLALFLLSVAESSFFPIPPDVLLLALCLGKPEKSFRFAAWCTAGSVIGGIIGWYIGLGMWAQLQDVMIPAVFPQAKFDQVMNIYQEYGVAFVFVAAFTPIPYKVFTIAAGVFKLNILAFAGVSLIGRGARFFLVAGLVKRYGDDARDFIDRNFNRLTMIAALLLVGGFALLKLH